MNKLTTIANRLDIDKGTVCTTGPHGYTETYHELFEPLLGMPIKMMEIGVYDPRFPGGSIKLWDEYFPQLWFIGMDINPEAKKFDKDNIHIFIGNQNNKQDLIECMYMFGDDFDIIIDDGSHYGEHILTSFKNLFPYVKPGGYYIIEDLHCVYTHADVTLPLLDNIIADKEWQLEKTFYHHNKLLVIKKTL
jgi:demethylmacrocin O-methyltransferase